MSTDILIRHANFEVSLLRLLQENGQKWWVILIMFEKLLEIDDNVNIELANCNKSHLCMSKND